MLARNESLKSRNYEQHQMLCLLSCYTLSGLYGSSLQLLLVYGDFFYSVLYLITKQHALLDYDQVTDLAIENVIISLFLLWETLGLFCKMLWVIISICTVKHWSVSFAAFGWVESPVHFYIFTQQSHNQQSSINTSGLHLAR